MVFHCFSWFFQRTGSMGTPWGPMGPMGTHGNPWEPMGTHGNPWKPMETHGNPWVPMGTHGDPWVPMGPHGAPWIPMGAHGTPITITNMRVPKPTRRYFLLFWGNRHSWVFWELRTVRIDPSRQVSIDEARAGPPYCFWASSGP